MRTRTILAAVALLAAGTLLGDPATAQESLEASLTSGQLAERALHRRAVEAVIWGMPAVNFDLIYQAMIRDAKAGAGSNKALLACE
jgi:hypothetical protein